MVYLNVEDYGAGQGNDDTQAFSDFYRDCKTSKVQGYIPSGTYNINNVSYEVTSGFWWLDDGFNLGLNLAKSARNSQVLITTETPETSPMNPEDSRVGLNATAVANGSNHASAVRANLNNGSDDGRGCTAFYGHAVSDDGAYWSAAVHGETRHGDGVSIGISSETAIYSDKGQPYGVVANNTTKGAHDLHPTTKQPKAYNPNATAFLVQGNGDWDQMAAWQYGFLATDPSIRDNGTVFRSNAQSKIGIHFSTQSRNDLADIYLQGNSKFGIVMTGDYESGLAMRIPAGQAIGLESTGTIRILWDNGQVNLNRHSENYFGFVLSKFDPYLKINGQRVLSKKQPAISDCVGDGDEKEKINKILQTLRNHGLIET